MMLVQFSAGVSLGSQLEEFSNFPYGNFRFVWKSVSGRVEEEERKERERERERAPAASDNVYKEEEALRTFAS